MWSQLEAWKHATTAQRLRLVDALSWGRREAQSLRRRVLAHPDIAQRLVTELGYQRPEQWFGYVPPRIGWYEGGTVWANGSNTEKVGVGNLNDSPRRRILLDILAAVMEREQAP